MLFSSICCSMDFSHCGMQVCAPLLHSLILLYILLSALQDWHNQVHNLVDRSCTINNQIKVVFQRFLECIQLRLEERRVEEMSLTVLQTVGENFARAF